MKREESQVTGKQFSQRGFTLIELILYIALVSIFMGGSILFVWDVIYARVKSTVQLEVSQNLRLASQKISYEIRNANGLNSLTASSLSLSSSDPARDPTVFDIAGDRVRVGYGSGGQCPTTSPCEITSNLVAATQLQFTDLSTGSGSINIGFSLTLENTAGRKSWQESKTYSTSVEIRSN